MTNDARPGKWGKLALMNAAVAAWIVYDWRRRAKRRGKPCSSWSICS